MAGRTVARASGGMRVAWVLGSCFLTVMCSVSLITPYRDLPSAKVMAGCELVVENSCRAAASCVLQRAQVMIMFFVMTIVVLVLVLVLVLVVVAKSWMR